MLKPRVRQRLARVLTAAAIVAASSMLAQPSAAQSTDAFGRPVAPGAASEHREAAQGDASAQASPFVLPAPVRRVIGASVRIQGEWNARMEDALGGLHGHDTPRLWWMLVALSFGYGVLHAFGPGHGKTAIAAYLGTRNARVAQAVGLGCWTAFVQAMSAIALVGATVLLIPEGIGRLLGEAANLTIVSDAALLAAGLWAAWSVLTHRGCCAVQPAVALLPRMRSGVPDGADAADGRDGRYLGARLAIGRGSGARLACTGTPQSQWSVGQALTTGFASGLRPCVGAIFMLVAASAQHAFAIGVVSTFAMAAGVALTVGAVGIGSLGASRLAFAGALGARRGASRVRRGAALAGALFIVAFAALQIVALLAGWSSGALT